MNEVTIFLSVIGSIISILVGINGIVSKHTKSSTDLTKVLTSLVTKFEIEIPALSKSIDDSNHINKENSDQLWEHIKKYTPDIIETKQRTDDHDSKLNHIESQIIVLDDRVDRLDSRVQGLEIKEQLHSNRKD